MKVKEYLVNRILELESDLKRVRNEKAGTVSGLQNLEKDVTKLKEQIQQYQIEREHIKQIIICGLAGDDDLYIAHYEDDIKTLLSILDIQPGDYKLVEEKKIPEQYDCPQCKHEAKSFCEEPCSSCLSCDKFEPKEVTTDAENKD